MLESESSQTDFNTMWIKLYTGIAHRNPNGAIVFNPLLPSSDFIDFTLLCLMPDDFTRQKETP